MYYQCIPFVACVGQSISTEPLNHCSLVRWQQTHFLFPALSVYLIWFSSFTMVPIYFLLCLEVLWAGTYLKRRKGIVRCWWIFKAYSYLNWPQAAGVLASNAKDYVHTKQNWLYTNILRDDDDDIITLYTEYYIIGPNHRFILGDPTLCIPPK